MNESLDKVTIITYILLPGEEVFGKTVEQHLTINRKGQIWLTNYQNSQYGKHRNTLNKQRWKIDATETRQIISGITDYSQKNSVARCGKEMVWYVSGTSNGQTVTIASGDVFDNDGSMTAWLRNQLGHDELIAFGGKGQTYNWEKIFA